MVTTFKMAARIGPYGLFLFPFMCTINLPNVPHLSCNTLYIKKYITPHRFTAFYSRRRRVMFCSLHFRFALSARARAHTRSL